MFETLKNMLVEELQLDPDEITPESELTNDLGINSIELADLVMTCEEKFGVEITDEKLRAAARKRNRLSKALCEMYNLQTNVQPAMKGLEMMIGLQQNTFSFDLDEQI